MICNSSFPHTVPLLWHKQNICKLYSHSFLWNGQLLPNTIVYFSLALVCPKLKKAWCIFNKETGGEILHWVKSLLWPQDIISTRKTILLFLIKRVLLFMYQIIWHCGLVSNTWGIFIATSLFSHDILMDRIFPLTSKKSCIQLSLL